MMQRIYVIGLLVCCCWATSLHAQSDFDYAKAFAEVDVFLEKFVEYSDFREPLKDQVSGNARDQFKGMFKPNVFIKDLYNPPRMDQKGQFMPLLPFTDKNPPKIRTIADFAEEVTRYCSHGISPKITGINADYSNISKGLVRLQVQRESSVRDYQDWRYTVFEEFTLELEWDAAQNRYMIAAMDIADNYVVKCSNCEDRFAARVDPADDPAKPIKLWASIQGLAGVSAVTAEQPQLSALSSTVYTDLIASESKLGTLKASGLRPCWGVEGAAQVMKGYKHQWGVSVGVGIFNTAARFDQEASTLVYKAKDELGNEYNRRLQIEASSIEASLLTLNAPIQVHYTRRLNKKLKLHGAVGATLAFAGTLNTRQNTSADYEALLKFKPGQNAGSEVTTTFATDGNYDAVLTESTLTDAQRADNPSLSNYDLAFNRPLSDDASVKVGIGYSLTARLGAGYMVNSSTEALLSAGVMSGVQRWDAPSLVLADRVKGDNQQLGSTLAAAGEWSSLNFVLSAGVRFYLSSFNK